MNSTEDDIVESGASAFDRCILHEFEALDKHHFGMSKRYKCKHCKSICYSSFVAGYHLGRIHQANQHAIKKFQEHIDAGRCRNNAAHSEDKSPTSQA